MSDRVPGAYAATLDDLKKHVPPSAPYLCDLGVLSAVDACMSVVLPGRRPHRASGVGSLRRHGRDVA